MAVIVRSNMCRGFPQAVRMDYSGLDVGGGLVGRAAGRGPAAIATTLRNAPGPACVMRAQRDGIHTTLRHASPARRNPPQLDPCRPTSHNASPADITKTTPRGRGHRGRQPRAGPPGWRRPPGGGAHRHALPAPAGHGQTSPKAGLTDGRRTGSRAAPRLPRGRRADGRCDRHDRTRSRPGRAAEASPFSRRRSRQAVFRRIPPALGPLLPWVPSVEWTEQGEDFREPSSSPRPRAPRPGPEGGALTCPLCWMCAAPPRPWWRWP